MAVPRYTRADSGENVAERFNEDFGGSSPVSGDTVKHLGHSQEKYVLALLRTQTKREKLIGLVCCADVYTHA